ncbi:MAG: LysR family transcriptional regulator [Pseudonocardia sp.]|nr:LysR family transcriptional regulator [Pseudonocardia sp.]
MELRHLQYFVAVAEEGTVTAAAARLHVAQPGVSAQLRRLERELGEPLFDRTSRGVTLTEAGRAVLPYARTALRAVEGARTAVDELTGLIRGRVAVGMASAMASSALPELLADFRDAHPGVEVTLTDGTSDDLVAALLDGRLDLAWIGLAGPAPDGVATRVVTEQELVVVGGDLPPEVGVVALRDRPLICMSRGTGLRAVVDSACAAAGFRPTVAFEAGDPLLLARLAARGLGIAVLPRAAVVAAGVEVGVSHLVPELSSRIELAWRAEGPSGPAARALVGFAVAALRRAA